MTKSLTLQHGQWLAMKEHVQAALPEEACGLIGGQAELARLVIPVENKLRSPQRFLMDPQQQLAGFLRLEELKLDLLAIYHSHPRGPRRPSPQDLGEAYFPHALSLIWAPLNGEWECQGFDLSLNPYRPVAITILD